MKNSTKHLIYGCMGLGEWNQNPINQTAIDKAFIALETAIASGITTFDHANIYTFGKAESIFGMYLQENPGLRSKIKINTKAGIILGSGISGSNTYNSNKAYLVGEIEKSIERLKCGYIDTFIIHRFDPLVSTKDLAATLDFIIETGLAKQIGLSNVPPKLFEKVSHNCQNALSCCQVQFSLGHSHLIKHHSFFNTKKGASFFDTLDDYNSQGLEIQAWGPLDKGLFLSSASENNSVRNTSILVQEMALRYNCSREAILLAWIYKLPFTISPIIGTTNPERIKNCLQKIELSQADWYNLWISALNEPLP